MRISFPYSFDSLWNMMLMRTISQFFRNRQWGKEVLEPVNIVFQAPLPSEQHRIRALKNVALSVQLSQDEVAALRRDKSEMEARRRKAKRDAAQVSSTSTESKSSISPIVLDESKENNIQVKKIKLLPAHSTRKYSGNPYDRVVKHPDHSLQVSNMKLFCRACSKAVQHMRNDTVDKHCQSRTHISRLASWNALRLKQQMLIKVRLLSFIHYVLSSIW